MYKEMWTSFFIMSFVKEIKRPAHGREDAGGGGWIIA